MQTIHRFKCGTKSGLHLQWEKNIHEWEKAFARRKKHIKNQSDITLPEWVKIIHTTKYSRSQHLAYFHLSRVHFVATPSHILNVRLCTLICFAIAISNSSFIITKCRTNVWHCFAPPKRAEQKKKRAQTCTVEIWNTIWYPKTSARKWMKGKLIGLRGWGNSSHFHKNFNEPIVKRWITVENIRWQKWMNKKEKKKRVRRTQIQKIWIQSEQGKNTLTVAFCEIQNLIH